jgi:MFS family permease
VYLGLVFIVGFNFGGCFVLYLTEIAHVYGPERVGTVYGPVYFVYALSGMAAPFVVGLTFDAWKNYLVSTGAGAAVAFCGLVAFALLYARPPAEPVETSEN